MGGCDGLSGMIRLATKEDISEMVRIGELFFNESGYAELSSYDPESVESYLSQFMDNGICILIVAEENGIVGVTGALLFPLYLNQSCILAQELFWWVHPEHRGGAGRDMLKLLESEAKTRGAKALIMLALEKLNPEFVGRLYKRLGYKLIEHQYIKVL